MTTPPKDQTTFGRGVTPCTVAAPATTRRTVAQRSSSPLATVRRACDNALWWVCEGLAVVLLVLCAWWGVELVAEGDDGVDWDH